MKNIRITEEQKNELCNEIAKLVFEFKENNDVECIYFSSYNGLGDIEGDVLELVLVRVHSFDDDVSDNITEYNNLYQEESSLRKFGIRILISGDSAHKYKRMDLNPSEVRRSNYLFNSIILFDRNGKYTKIKERTEEYGVNQAAGIFYYSNRALVIPPIIDGITREMEIIKIENDTKVVKKLRRHATF